jgi:hypothetical protein
MPSGGPTGAADPCVGRRGDACKVTPIKARAASHASPVLRRGTSISAQACFAPTASRHIRHHAATTAEVDWPRRSVVVHQVLPSCILSTHGPQPPVVREGATHAVSHLVRGASPFLPGRDGRRAAGLRGTNGASPLRNPSHALSRPQARSSPTTSRWQAWMSIHAAAVGFEATGSRLKGVWSCLHDRTIRRGCRRVARPIVRHGD